MDTRIANMDNSHCHTHGHNNRKGVVEVEKVVKPKKGLLHRVVRMKKT